MCPYFKELRDSFGEKGWYGFIQEISDKEWDNARNYCIYGSEAWGFIEEFEENFYFSNLPDGNLNININEITIDGEYAKAYVHGSATGTFASVLQYLFIGGSFIWNPGEEREASGEGWFYLQKIGNDWELYSFGDIPFPEAPPV